MMLVLLIVLIALATATNYCANWGGTFPAVLATDIFTKANKPYLLELVAFNASLGIASEVNIVKNYSAIVQAQFTACAALNATLGTKFCLGYAQQLPGIPVYMCARSACTSCVTAFANSYGFSTKLNFTGQIAAVTVADLGFNTAGISTCTASAGGSPSIIDPVFMANIEYIVCVTVAKKISNKGPSYTTAAITKLGACNAVMSTQCNAVSTASVCKATFYSSAAGAGLPFRGCHYDGCLQCETFMNNFWSVAIATGDLGTGLYSFAEVYNPADSGVNTAGTASTASTAGSASSLSVVAALGLATLGTALVGVY